jgi:hypothetical protein
MWLQGQNSWVMPVGGMTSVVVTMWTVRMRVCKPSTW